jgi:hypothetical protein
VGVLEACHFGQDLDCAAAVADQADAFAGVVEAVVPAGAVYFVASEVVYTWNSGPLPVAQNAASRDQNVGVLGARAGILVADDELPLRLGFNPLGALNGRVELHVAVELPLPDCSLEVFANLSAGRVEM